MNPPADPAPVGGLGEAPVAAPHECQVNRVGKLYEGLDRLGDRVAGLGVAGHHQQELAGAQPGRLPHPDRGGAVEPGVLEVAHHDRPAAEAAREQRGDPSLTVEIAAAPAAQWRSSRSNRERVSLESWSASISCVASQ